MLFFPTKWNDDNENVRIYGYTNKSSEITCLNVKFDSSIYIELNPYYKTGDDMSKINFIVHKFNLFVKSKHNGWDVKPTKCEVKMMHKMVGANIDKDGLNTKFEFLHLKFSSKYLVYLFNSFLTSGFCFKNEKYVLNSYFYDYDLWLQLALEQNLPICNWICVKNFVSTLKKNTRCEFEYDVVSTDLVNEENPPNAPKLKILAYDIEVYSHIAGKFPESTFEEDKVFQISIVCESNIYLITRGIINCEKIYKRFNNYKIIIFEEKSEMNLLKKFIEIVNQEKPNIVTGYNNLKFDFPYMIFRAKNFCNCWLDFEKFSLNLNIKAQDKSIKWTSQAYSNQQFNFLESEGYTNFDVYAFIQQNFKLNNYSLNFVSEHFLNSKKDDLNHLFLRRAYEKCMQKINHEESIRDITLVAEYCIQDSILVIELFNKLKISNYLISLSNVTSINLESIFIRGVTFKIKNLIKRFCFLNNYIVNKSLKNDSMKIKYVGAFVFDPILGFHKNVVSFDFQSLYPSIMMQNNLCTSTLLDPELHSHISDEMCFVHKWGDHIKCNHDTKWFTKQNLNKEIIQIRKKCKKDLCNEDYEILKQKTDEFEKYSTYNPNVTFCQDRYFRWYKGYKGIIPMILEKLTKERYCVKAEMKKISKELENEKDDLKKIELEDRINAFDGKQNALKIVANGVYGFCGAKSDFENLTPIAMCTTYCGRIYITRISEFIKGNYNGQVIYGDTDSNYVHFPDVDFKDLSKFCYKVASEMSNLFEKNTDGDQIIKILYEEKIMDMIIPTKKNYLMKLLNENNKIKAKGVMMVKRDNCKFIVSVYSQIIDLIFKTTNFDDLLFCIVENSLKIIQRQVDYENLKISKSIGSWGDGNSFVNGDGTITIGKYKVRKIMGSVEQVEETLRLKKFSCLEDYYKSCLPASIQLVFRMLKRGTLITPGERIDYLVTGLYKSNEKLENRIEQIDFFKLNSEIYDIDYLHYLKKLYNALDGLICIIYKDLKQINFDDEKLICLTKKKMKESNEYENCKKCFRCLTKMRLYIENNNGPCKNLFLQFQNKLKVNQEIQKLFLENKFVKNEKRKNSMDYYFSKKIKI